MTAGWISGSSHAAARAIRGLLWLGLVFVFCIAMPVLAQQKVKVGVYESMPKVGVSATGKPQGIFIDIIETIAKQEGWQLEYVRVGWSEGLELLKIGELDLLPGVAENEVRRVTYAFHEVLVYPSWSTVFTRPKSGVRSMLDLQSRSVAVLEDSIQFALFEQMADAFNLPLTLVKVQSYDQGFAMVARGEADAVVTNRFFGRFNGAKYGLEDTSILFAPTKSFFAAPPKGREDLLAAIDLRLVDLKNDPDSEYYKSMRRWAGEDIESVVPPWVMPTVIGACVALLLGLAWVYALRRQVAAKTSEIRRTRDEVLIINSMLRAIGTLPDTGVVMDEAVKAAVALTGCDGGAYRDASSAALLAPLVGANRHVVLAAADVPELPGVQSATDNSARWQAFFPLRVQDRTIGAFSLFSRKEEKPSAHGMQLVEDICGPVALALENARLAQEARDHALQLERRVVRRTSEIEGLRAFLQLLIDRMANPIFYKGPDLRFLGCNDAYEQAFGISRSYLVGKTVLDLEYLPQADREQFQQEDAQVLAAATTVRRDAAIPFADGKLHQTLYSVSGFRNPDGAAAGVVGVIVDITPITEAQEALRAANAEHSAIFEAANFGIALSQGRVVRRCNRQMERIFGYAPGELHQQSTRVWYASDEAFALGGELATHELDNGQTHRREEQLLRKDGSQFWCRLTARALDPTDLEKGVVTVIEDVTQERAAAVALREAKEAAEAADRLKSAFLATMSHELRTPMNSIIGFTGIVLQGLAGPVTAEQGKQLGMVRDSAKHLLSLINDVLDISKIEAGELTVACESFDLPQSLEKVVGIVRPMADKKGLALQMRIAPEIGRMTSDARRVEQVMLNLLGNAIKFSEAGSVTLEATAGSAILGGEGSEPQPAVTLTVTDTGMGIKPEDMAVLFTPFRQIDSELSRKHDGTGLGLAICQKLALLMGGTIEAQSEFGRGSTFTVVLPVTASHAREKK